MSNHGKAWWNELNTRNIEGAKAFYGNVIGWKFEDMDMAEGGTYTLAMHAAGPAGGMFSLTGDEFAGIPPHWMTYFAVDDVDAACAAVKDNGGTVKQDPFDVAGVGRIAVVGDPDGAIFGLMTPVEGADAPQ